MSGVAIRRLAPGDRAAWERLWEGYNRFYEREVEARVTDRLWSHLSAGQGEPSGFAAEVDGEVAGLAHYFFQPSTSDWAPRCYLQDLFVDPVRRGRGIGEALIRAVYGEADRHGAAQTYWLTQDFNVTARRLYDRVANATPFVKYMR